MAKIELLSDAKEKELRGKLNRIKEKSKESRLGGDGTEMFHLGTVAGVDIGYATLPVAASISILLASFVIFSISGLFTLQNAYYRNQQLKIEATLRKNDVLKRMSELENDSENQAHQKYLDEALENVDAWYRSERTRLVGRAVLSGLLQVAIGAFGTAVSIAFLFGVGASLQLFVPAMLLITNVAVIAASAWTTAWDVVKVATAYRELSSARKNIIEYERQHPAATKENDSVLKILFEQEAQLEKHYNTRIKKMAASASMSMVTIAGMAIAIVTVLGLLSVPPVALGILTTAAFVITAGTFIYYNREKINSVFSDTVAKFKNFFGIENSIGSKKEHAVSKDKSAVFTQQPPHAIRESGKAESNTVSTHNAPQSATEKMFSPVGKVRFPWSKPKPKILEKSPLIKAGEDEDDDREGESERGSPEETSKRESKPPH